MKITTNNHFGDWIKTIPVGEYDSIRQRVINECMISLSVFNHWRLGNSKVPPLAQEKINQIAGKEIFKMETHVCETQATKTHNRPAVVRNETD